MIAQRLCEQAAPLWPAASRGPWDAFIVDAMLPSAAHAVRSLRGFAESVRDVHLRPAFATLSMRRTPSLEGGDTARIEAELAKVEAAAHQLEREAAALNPEEDEEKDAELDDAQVRSLRSGRDDVAQWLNAVWPETEHPPSDAWAAFNRCGAALETRVKDAEKRVEEGVKRG